MPRPSRSQPSSSSSSSRKRTPPRRTRKTSAALSPPSAFPDRAMFDALSRSRADLIAAGLSLLSARHHLTNLRFLGPHETGPAPRGALRAEVRDDDFTHGLLMCTGRSTPALRRSLALSAHWLAAWLTLHRRFESLRSLALTDPLTGAWNRRYFDAFLASALDDDAHPSSSPRPVTLVLLDIDNFKAFNDRFGHSTGDDILRRVASLLASAIRPTDRVCRIGGDEFAVIFSSPPRSASSASASPHNAQAIIDRFHRRLASSRFPRPLTVSAGLASFPADGGGGADPATLISIADHRLMASKRERKK